MVALVHDNPLSEYLHPPIEERLILAGFLLVSVDSCSLGSRPCLRRKHSLVPLEFHAPTRTECWSWRIDEFDNHTYDIKMAIVQNLPFEHACTAEPCYGRIDYAWASDGVRHGEKRSPDIAESQHR
ncbi:hypothetical protein WCLP8_4170004 [uncultured Gammaproteobacteria bacterium]